MSGLLIPFWLCRPLIIIGLSFFSASSFLHSYCCCCLSGCCGSSRLPPSFSLPPSASLSCQQPGLAHSRSPARLVSVKYVPTIPVPVARPHPRCPSLPCPWSRPVRTARCSPACGLLPLLACCLLLLPDRSLLPSRSLLLLRLLLLQLAACRRLTACRCPLAAWCCLTRSPSPLLARSMPPLPRRSPSQLSAACCC